VKIGYCKTCYRIGILTCWGECRQCQDDRWERMEQEADEAIERGEMAGPFDVEELIEYLRRER
jgi:hypothetical protein